MANIIRKSLAICLGILLAWSGMQGQNNEPDLIFELNVANDMTYFTDHYFSSGISLEVYAPFMEKSPFNKIMLPHHIDALNYYSLTLTHHLYTPIYSDLFSDRSIDHPFAAYLLIGNRKESYHPFRRYKLSSELQFGFIGPLAGGHIFQNNLHEHIAIADPVPGWEYQIKNDICLEYSSMIEKGIVDIPWLEINAYAGGKIGQPHTELQVGTYCRLGYFDDYFRHIGLNHNGSWQIWLFIAGDVTFVAYNAVLEGGIFNSRDSNTLDNIKHIMWHTSFGGTFVYKTIKFEMAQEVLSPSFQTGLWHRWAYISLMFGF